MNKTIIIKKNTPIIYDVDTGSDDALALIYVQISGLIADYVITSFGNVSLSTVTKNTCMILDAIDNSQTKIIEGLANPLTKKIQRKDKYTGLCGITFPIRDKTRIIGKLRENISRLFELSSITYVITGPCTNFAWILKNYPTIKSKIDQVVIMGGGIKRKGNVTDYAEFNFYQDPVAVDIVLKSGLPVYLITLDATAQAMLPVNKINQLQLSQNGKIIQQIVNAYFSTFNINPTQGYELFDPLTIGALQGYISFTKKKVGIVTKGSQKGELVINPKGTSVNIAQKVNGRNFVNRFIRTMKINQKIDRTNLKLICFDMWKTLVSETSSLEKLFKIFTRSKATAKFEEFVKLDEEILMKKSVDLQVGLFKIAKIMGIDDNQAVIKVYKEWEKSVKNCSLFEGVEMILRKLRKQEFKLGLITNTTKTGWLAVNNKFKLNQYFDVLVLSYEQGWIKPNPKIFELVEKTTGYKGSQILMIGDTYRSDIEPTINRVWQSRLVKQPSNDLEKLLKDLGIK